MAADHGEPVGERADGDLDLWCRIVVAAAELQREVAAYADELGLVTIAPHEGPAWVAAMVEHLAALPADDPRRLAEDDATRLRALQPQLQAWADQVAALGLPLTLVHNDLHAHNVFAVDDRLVLFDLGDAVVMEPLAGLLIPLGCSPTSSTPGRTTPGCCGSPRRASRSGATWRRPPSCAPRCPPRSSWPAWAGSSPGTG